MNNFVCIVQARLTSSRFPKKVLKKILGHSIIEIIHQRLSRSVTLNKIVYAIPSNNNNRLLKNFLEKKNLTYFCGSEDNVLERYFFAAKKFKADYILRVTADCPLVDHKLVDKMYKIIKKNKIDYISNTNPPTFPDGLDLEIFTLKALKIAYKYSISDYEKEHVTPYLIKSPYIKKFNFLNKKNLKSYNLTLDTKKDFKNLKKIFLHSKSIFLNTKQLTKFITKDKKNFKTSFEEKHKGKFLNKSSRHWNKAKEFIPDGNNFLSKRIDINSVKNWPAYYSKAKNCFIWDLDGVRYIDFGLMGVGTNVLGYNNSKINNEVKKSIDKSNMSSLNCPEEVDLAEKLVKIHPWASKVKFARTGGEANAIAVRIARAFTNSHKIAVCGYHGWHDWYLAANLKDPNNLKNHLMKNLQTNGVPKNLSNSTFSFEYNDFNGMKNIIEKENIKIIKMEVKRFEPPKNNFLKKIRSYTEKNNIILIFDECTTGFREIFGGLHMKYNVRPDIAIFGKAIANGFALTAVIGKEEVMQKAEESFISSTFWSERSGYVAALKTIETMERENINQKINHIGKKIKLKWKNLFKKYKIPVRIYGSNSCPIFEIKDIKKFNYINYIAEKMLEKKILFKNIVYVSISHSNKILAKYFHSLESVIKNINLKLK